MVRKLRDFECERKVSLISFFIEIINIGFCLEFSEISRIV